MSITVIWSAAQPSAIALPRRSYWRIADSVLWMTCLRLDWRTYKQSRPGQVGGGHLRRRGIGEHRGLLRDEQPVTGPGRWRSGERDGRQGADELGGHRGREPGGPGGAVPGAGRAAGGGAAGWRAARPARACRQAVTPPPVSTPSPSGNASRARVQGGMAQLLVAGVQPAAGGAVLAGIQAGAWFSSRVAR